jgi:hypothetical protein
MTCLAGVAQCKGCSHTGLRIDQRRRKNWTRENIARGTSKKQMLERRQWMWQEGSNGIRD